MTLQQFITRQHLDLDPFVQKACIYAINLMNLGQDPLHSGSHVYAILDNLDKFLSENREVNKKDIDFAVLLLAICWHDVWRSNKSRKSIKNLLYEELYEGIGSMRILGKNSRHLRLNQRHVSAAKYAIRKHTRYQIFDHKTLESKILFDMDTLENWSMDRVEKAFIKFGGLKNIPPFLIRVGKFFFERMMLSRSPNDLFFDWSKKEFEERRAVFLSELIKTGRKYYKVFQKQHRLPPYRDLAAKYSPEQTSSQ